MWYDLVAMELTKGVFDVVLAFPQPQLVIACVQAGTQSNARRRLGSAPLRWGDGCRYLAMISSTAEENQLSGAATHQAQRRRVHTYF